MVYTSRGFKVLQFEFSETKIRSIRGTRTEYSKIQSRNVHPIGDIAAKWLLTA